MDIQSPFESDIKQCKMSMRKLRKKIYKYSTTHKVHQKSKDSVHGILDRLKEREIPQFLIDSLKKRRNFELNAIKNVNVADDISFTEIKNMRAQQ